MPRVPYRYPAPSTDAVADRIRQRRGARGLTPLDGMLLNAPNVADGWNTFVGGLRTRTSLRDDIRELMVSPGVSLFDVVSFVGGRLLNDGWIVACTVDPPSSSV